jgi:hypothetical protein
MLTLTASSRIPCFRGQRLPKCHWIAGNLNGRLRHSRRSLPFTFETQNITQRDRYLERHQTPTLRDARRTQPYRLLMILGTQTPHTTLLGTQRFTLYSLPKHTPAAPRSVGNFVWQPRSTSLREVTNGARQRYKRGDLRNPKPHYYRPTQPQQA